MFAEPLHVCYMQAGSDVRAKSVYRTEYDIDKLVDPCRYILLKST